MKNPLMWLGIIDDPEEIAKRKSIQELHGNTIKVTRVTVFDDDIAYHGRRGIYLIEDTVTGSRFIGVSGIGISELGSHTEGSGKTRRTVTDER